MNVYKITFSPTGGTEKNADRLVAVFGQDIQSIDLTDPAADYGQIIPNPDDICITSVPSFGGRVPASAASRLAKIQVQGAKAIVTVVYGNRDYDDTLLELQNILTGAGFRYAAGVAAVAEHSILRQFAQGRPDAEDESQLSQFAGQIWEAIETGNINIRLAIPADSPSQTDTKACISCMRCVSICPAHARSVHPLMLAAAAQKMKKSCQTRKENELFL